MSDKLLPDPRFIPPMPGIQPPRQDGPNREDFQRLESKVDLLSAMVRTLIRALAEDEDPETGDLFDLEGTVVGKERDTTQSLG